MQYKRHFKKDVTDKQRTYGDFLNKRILHEMTGETSRLQEETHLHSLHGLYNLKIIEGYFELHTYNAA